MKLPIRGNLVVVISGPSGVGKDAVVRGLRELDKEDRHYAVTATTRTKRPWEVDGVSYHFLTTEEFLDRREKGGFLEWAVVYGSYYGVPRQEVEAGLARNRDVIIKTDVQGAATIKELIPDGVIIFLAPSSEEELLGRLSKRGSESLSDLQLRLDTAREELNQIPNFDYVVVNRDGMLQEAIEKVEAIIQAEKCRVVRGRNIPHCR